MSPQIFNLYLFSYIYAILSQLYIFLLTPTALRDNFLTSSRRSERGGKDGEEEEEPSRSLCIDGTWSTDNLGCSLSAWSLSAWSAANLECSQPGVQPGYLSTCLPDSLSTCLSDSLSGYGVAGIWGPRKRLSTFRVPSSRERFGGKDILRGFIARLSLPLHLARFRSDFLLMVAN